MGIGRRSDVTYRALTYIQDVFLHRGARLLWIFIYESRKDV
jgi:hypothetical protein